MLYRSIRFVFSWVVPGGINYLPGDTSIIYAIELLAVVLTIYEMRFMPRNISIVFGVGNAASCALIKWARNHDLADRYISVFYPSILSITYRYVCDR